MMCLKQSTSVDVPVGPFLDETDGKTAETALTITQPDVRLKKNGGAWAQKAAAQTLTHEEAGWYEVTLDATDTDTVGHLIVAIHESGALPVWREFHVLEEAVYDALFAASANGFAGAAGASTVTFSNTSIATVTNLTNLPTIPANWLTAAGTAADFSTELRTAINGGDWALSTDSNGRIRIVDGTGTGELDTLSGTVLLRAANEAVLADWIDAGRLDVLLDAIKAKTDSLTFTVANQVDSNAVAISADSVAADRLETMLDGTGGQTLSLGRLVMSSSSSPIDITYSGVSAAINVAATSGIAAYLNSANGVQIQSSSGSPLQILSPAGQAGLFFSAASPTAPGIIGAGFYSMATSNGTTTTLIDTARTEATTDHWKGCKIRFLSGTNLGQERLITGFNITTDEITFAPAVNVATVTGALYEILPASRVDIHSVAGTAQTAGDLAALINTIDDLLDTEVAAIKSDTAAILGQTGTTGVVVADLTTAALTELRTYLYGADVAQQIDASGYVKVSDGTGTGQIALTSGKIDGITGTIATLDALLTTAITESYAADGAAPSISQALMLIQQYLTEKSISGTALTVKKLDGSTTAAVLTLNSSTAPTSSTRAS